MKRKVIKHGSTTLSVSLPQDWAKKFNIKKGDELFVEEQGSNLFLMSKNDEKPKEIELDISNFDRTSILLAMRYAYRTGYDQIILKFKNTTTVYLRTNQTLGVLEVIHEEANRMLGVEIIHENDNLCSIKDFSRSIEQDFETFYRKIFVLLLDTVRATINSINKCDLITLENIRQKEDTISKYINYCLRLINKKGQINEINFHHQSILMTIDYLIYLYRLSVLEYAEYFDKKYSKEIANFLEDIYELINIFQILIFSYKPDLIFNFAKKRDSIAKKIGALSKTVPKDHLIFLVKIGQIADYFSRVNPIKRIERI